MTEKEIQILLDKIAFLENENNKLKENLFPFKSSKKTVSVPAEIQPLFDHAEEVVAKYFSKIKANPSEGSIEINDERYVLLRASSLSVDFLNKIKSLYSDKGEEEAMLIGRKFLFDISHVIGNEDAKNFHQKMHVNDPISKLSAGPIHFAYSGWAKVEILPESNPTPNENFFLKYNHPYSFEADSWISKGIKADSPVCIMNSGYSSGWCEESFGIPLTAVEISCRAKGDSSCTFIMAPPEKIESYLKGELIQNSTNKAYEIPLFFERKKAEDKIIQSLKEKDILIKEVHHRVKNNLQIISSFLNLQSMYLPESETKDAFKKTISRVKSIALVHEKLYQSDNFEKINIKQYVESIVDLLKETYNQNTLIETFVNINANTFFNIDSAIPCGLILNELISNSIKHAKNNKGIIIKVVFSEKEDVFEIVVKDNGENIKSDFNIYNSKSLGMEIILSLVEQLNGTIETNFDHGAVFSIIFKK